jgi:hypothetical protein
VNTDNLTIEDVLDMSDRERDRVAGEWLDEVVTKITLIPKDPPPKGWPHYHTRWKHAGRLLEALPSLFKASPVNWIAENIFKPCHEKDIPTDDIPGGLCKESIVLAACICAVRGVEPEVNNE